MRHRTKYHCVIKHDNVPISDHIVWEGDKWKDFIFTLRKVCREYEEKYGVTATTIKVVVINQWSGSSRQGSATEIFQIGKTPPFFFDGSK